MACAKRLLALNMRKTFTAKITGKCEYKFTAAFSNVDVLNSDDSIEDLQKLPYDFRKDINFLYVVEEFENLDAAKKYYNNMLNRQHCWECMKIKNFLDCKFN